MKQFTKKLPVDIQSFEIMQTENYMYVDKTGHILMGINVNSETRNPEEWKVKNVKRNA